MEDDQKAKKKGTIPNKGSLQSYIQNFTKEAIDTLVDIMRNTRNENLRMGAAKVIIDKSIPDIKAVEIGGVNGEPIKLFISAGSGFIPATVTTIAASTSGDAGGLTQIQSVNMAQTGQKDDNSDNGVGETGAS